ncbi:hypothetical protein, partial [Aeromonas sp. QDB14]|uniref:hypothetical protein n=1 Tax=Aeromonas sp. QDB14 TaxID=2989836 RepID=UPI0022E1E897
RETRAGAKRGCLKQLCATTILKNAGMLAERIEADSQSTFKNRHDLGGGITLFKQKGSSRWHCRVHQPADGIHDYRQSTRKLDLRDATSEAHQIALMLKIKLSSGVALKNGITFKTIANEIVQFYLKRSKPIDTYYISLIKNHLLPYFGEQEIASINDRSVREGANKRGNSSRLTQSFHFFMFEP